MPIIGALPNNIQNGQAVDANPVMADFNYIVNQVNSNANPIGTLTAPSGTRAVFHQAGAPTGWAIDATITDHTIQVVASGGAINTGASGYSAMFLNQWATDGHTLSIAEMPAHAHSDAGHAHGTTDPGHNHQPQDLHSFYTDGTASSLSAPGNQPFDKKGITTTVTTGITINTGNANIQNTGGGGSHSHTKTFNVNYITCIVAVKS